MKNSYFLDTSYSVALAIEKDQFHEKAVKLSFELAAHDSEIITTHGVLLEIGNALAKQAYRPAAVRMLQHYEFDLKTRVVGVSQELYDSAFILFSERTDKEWSLVDCISFTVMQQFEIESALTADRHFIQAGFRALLRED